MTKTPADNEATLVRIDGSKGFIEGNVKVVSAKAARIIEFLRTEGITKMQLFDLRTFLPDAGEEQGMCWNLGGGNYSADGLIPALEAIIEKAAAPDRQELAREARAYLEHWHGRLQMPFADVLGVMAASLVVKEVARPGDE
jgi:hypothetical protein